MPETEREPIVREAAASARALFGRLKPIPPARSAAEKNSGLRLVYVKGIQRARIRDVRNHLRNLSIRTSRIEEIQFCGRETAEFLVHQDYADTFIKRIQELRGHIKADYDPLTPPPRQGESMVPEDVLVAAETLFLARIQRAIDRRPTGIAATFFTSWCKEKDLPLLTTPTKDTPAALVETDSEANTTTTTLSLRPHKNLANDRDKQSHNITPTSRASLQKNLTIFAT